MSLTNLVTRRLTSFNRQRRDVSNQLRLHVEANICRVCQCNENDDLYDAIIYAHTLSSAITRGRGGACYRDRMIKTSSNSHQFRKK